MNDISDYELIMLYLEKNENAELILFKRYEKLIYTYINKYKNILYKLNINKDDLFNRCLETFNEAINRYNDKSSASFKTFASLLIKRRIYKEIIKGSNNKNNLFNSSLSLDYKYDDIFLSDLIEDKKEIDPLNKLLLKENINNILNIAKMSLSKNELIVYKLLTCNLSYLEIAKLTNKNYKQVSNTIDRIRRKLKIQLVSFST